MHAHTRARMHACTDMYTHYVLYYTYILLHVVAPPNIIIEPMSQNINLTQVADFTCYATGYKVQYHWMIGSGSFPSKVTGIYSNTLVIPDVKSSDDNTYTCIATNTGGSTASNMARLMVTGMNMIFFDGIK